MVFEMLMFCASKQQLTYLDYVLVLILTDKMRGFQATLCKHLHENGILEREFFFISH